MKSKLYLTGITIIAAVVIASCAQKVIAEENNKATIMDFDTTGYTSGTIVQSKVEGDCEWTIKLEDGRHFDPMTIDKGFMENGAPVWFKYTPQRRANRCKKATPIAITEIKMGK